MPLDNPAKEFVAITARPGTGDDGAAESTTYVYPTEPHYDELRALLTKIRTDHELDQSPSKEDA